MSASTMSAAACRQCGRPLQNPQRCRACGAFQPPDPLRDHFATLALPRRFDVDEALLERRLIEFGRDLHPDRVGDGCQKAFAVLAAAQVNESFGVLKDAYRRGEYLLKLEGGKPAAEDKSVPEGFLEAMLEEREALEEATAGGGDALARAREHFEQELLGKAQQLARGFAALATAAERAPQLAALRRMLNVMAYYRGLLRELREAAHHE